MAKKPRDRTLGLISDAPAPDALLEVARQAFAERGFSGARIDDATARAAAGDDACGPGYVRMDHLFLALWQQHEACYADAVRTAVTQARQSGVTDPAALFETGSRAFLQGSWLRRDLALLFSSGDTPAQFAAVRRYQRHRWLHRNAVLLRLDDSPGDRLHTAVLTTVVGRGAREVAVAGDFRQAQAVTDAVVGYTRLLMAAHPAPGQRAERLSTS
jgi:hypothetical protein